jgi:hypothetical protein
MVDFPVASGPTNAITAPPPPGVRRFRDPRTWYTARLAKARTPALQDPTSELCANPSRQNDATPEGRRGEKCVESPREEIGAESWEPDREQRTRFAPCFVGCEPRSLATDIVPRPQEERQLGERRVLQRHAQHEDDELGALWGNADCAVSPGVGKEHLLERQVVVLGQAVARDDAVVGVHVDDRAFRFVQREMVLHGWKRRETHLDGRAEAELLEDRPKRGSVLPPDEQIDISLRVEGLLEDPVALPVAVLDAAGFQALEERGDGREHR